jgi:V/A-type H+/Na+-transporting ATPase subunit D
VAKLQVAPTKSNLIALKEQLVVAHEGYDLLEQKREILVMELMRLVEEVKLMEQAMAKASDSAYSSLKRMLLSVGRDRAREIASGVEYSFEFIERASTVAGIGLPSLELKPAQHRLQYSFGNSFADCDETMIEFLSFLGLAARMASLRTMVWRLAKEVKKTQRRVNALEKMVIPDTEDTKRYIEGVLEERERESFFVQKMLKARREGGIAD